MKAEETVMRYQHSHEIIVDSKEWHHKEGYNLGATTQAEISFKAGIREVVEWLRENGGEPDHILDKWETKLKEWGIS